MQRSRVPLWKETGVRAQTGLRLLSYSDVGSLDGWYQRSWFKSGLFIYYRTWSKGVRRLQFKVSRWSGLTNCSWHLAHDQRAYVDCRPARRASDQALRWIQFKKDWGHEAEQNSPQKFCSGVSRNKIHWPACKCFLTIVGVFHLDYRSPLWT